VRRDGGKSSGQCAEKHSEVPKNIPVAGTSLVVDILVLKFALEISGQLVSGAFLLFRAQTEGSILGFYI